MKILLSGGGTLGSVTPLLAIVETLKSRSSPVQNFEFYWLGTRRGVEKELIQKENIKFKPIFNGKFRRYFSLRNFIDPVFIILGFFQSLIAVFRFKPDIVLSAGSFVSAPVAWAAWLLGKPIIIHQQDLRPSLANKLASFCAAKITVTFEKSTRDFPADKVVWTGNPVRAEIFRGSKESAEVNFGLEKNLPTVLFMGGGAGSKSLNQFIAEIAPDLASFCQIIHLTGRGKSTEVKWPAGSLPSRYHQYELLTNELKDVYAASDFVVCRAGLGALTELAALAKPLILIPLPGTHQEDNGNYLKNKKAAVVLNQKGLTNKILFQEIKGLLEDKILQEELSRNISRVMKKNAASQIVDLIFNIKRQKI